MGFGSAVTVRAVGRRPALGLSKRTTTAAISSLVLTNTIGNGGRRLSRAITDCTASAMGVAVTGSAITQLEVKQNSRSTLWYAATTAATTTRSAGGGRNANATTNGVGQAFHLAVAATRMDCRMARGRIAVSGSAATSATDMATAINAIATSAPTEASLTDSPISRSRATASGTTTARRGATIFTSGTAGGLAMVSYTQHAVITGLATAIAAIFMGVVGDATTTSREGRARIARAI